MSGQVLLTGASGVVGSALLDILPADDLILGRHRVQPDSAAQQIAIDIRKPRLGLSAKDYTNLTGKITGIIHCAAMTEMNGQTAGLEETNIEGVRHMVALATDADVPLHYLSTAYSSRRFGPKIAAPSPYVRSKQAAEAIIRESDLNWTIIRPSIVAGHSTTGAIAAFQGFHLFFASMVSGRLPFIPLDRHAHCDFIPVDLLARSINEIIRKPIFGKTYWLTAGDQAMSVSEMIECGQPFALERGQDLHKLTIADPKTANSDLLPFLDRKLPKGLRERLDMLMEMASVMATKEPFPSDLTALLPDQPLSSAFLESVLVANIRYWGAANNRPFKYGVAA